MWLSMFWRSLPLLSSGQKPTSLCTVITKRPISESMIKLYEAIDWINGAQYLAREMTFACLFHYIQNSFSLFYLLDFHVWVEEVRA
jgi:hypothetical protein